MQAPQLIDLPQPEWLEMLRAEVQKPGRTITDVAAEIGMPRPTLSMLLAGTYPAKLDKITRRFASKVFGRYRDQVFCPHQRRGIGTEVCRRLAAAPMSTSDPKKLAQWIACRRCALNPVNKKDA